MMGSEISKFLPPIMDSPNEYDEDTGPKVNPHLENKPKPPRKRKREIYNPDIYKKLNKHIENTPKRLLHMEVKYLVKYLTYSCADDVAKVHALFYWVTSQSFLVYPDENSKKYSAVWYLKKIFNGHGNFAHFFYILCWHADIPCIIIGGFTKNSAYEIGFPFVTGDMAAQWNAVFVKGDWHFASIQWACIFANGPNDWKKVLLVTENEFTSRENASSDQHKDYNNYAIPQKPKTKKEYFHRVNDYYFLTDPDEFIWTHFPNTRQWQLLDNPITLEEFLNHFYVREQFYLLDMSLTKKSHRDCVLLVGKSHEVQIEFALPPNCSSTYRFKYRLSHHWSSWFSDKHQSLLQLGKYEVKDNRFSLTLQFISEGTYKLDIFGSKKENCDFYLICSYIVKCSSGEERPELPWKFFLGYGSDFNPLKKKIETNKNRIKLPFPIKKDVTLTHLLTRRGNVVKGCSLLRMIDEDDKSEFLTMIIELRLPEPGNYSLSLHAKKDTEHETLCDYSIIYKEDSETSSSMLEGSASKDTFISEEKKVVVLSHPGSFIQTNLDTLKILFRSKYQLSCKLIAHDASANGSKKTSVLHDMATKECQFNVTIPTCGDYTLKIFATFGDAEVLGDGGGQFYELHSYSIKKINPDQFSNRSVDTSRSASAHILGTFETYESVINIAQTDCRDEILVVFQSQNEAALCSNLVNIFKVEGVSYIQATLPQIGDYLLSLLKKDYVTGLVKSVTRYLLRRRQVIEKIDAGDINYNKKECQVKRDRSQEGLSQKEIAVEIKGKTLENKSETLTRQTKDTLNQTDEMKVKETERVKTTLPNINNSPFNLTTRVQNDVEKKTREFPEDKNAALHQPKRPSISTYNNRSVESVGVEESADPIKTDQQSKIDEPVRKKDVLGTTDNTHKSFEPEEKIPKSNTMKKQEPLCEDQTEKTKENEFSDGRLVQQLEYAIMKRDIDLLKSAISCSNKHVKSDILNQAKKLLDLLQAKKDLIEAYASRKKELLAAALEEARRVNFDNELNEEIAAVDKLYKGISELNELCYTIGSFDHRAVSEVKSYCNPPKAIIAVMKAIFLILEEPENELKEWKQIRTLMRSIQKPFIRRILYCNPRYVSLESVKAADVALGILNVEEMSSISEMAKVLFTWVKKIIEVAKNQELNSELEH